MIKESIVLNAEVDGDAGTSNNDEETQTPGNIEHEVRQETAITL